jgi:carbon-monoxide dehydrogenase iron sulfur subunit
MAKLIFVDTEKCVGCMACVLACSLEHGDTISPTHSRILPVRLRKQAIHIPVVCRQCANPFADACPMGAIARNEETNAMIVDTDYASAAGLHDCLSSRGISLDPSRPFGQV